MSCLRVLRSMASSRPSDLYERELSLYSGNLVETIYSELSVRVE